MNGHLIGYFSGVIYSFDDVLPVVLVTVPRELKNAQFFSVNGKYYLYKCETGVVYSYNGLGFNSIE